MNKQTKLNTFSFIGDGKMSNEIQKLSLERGHQIGVIIDKDDQWNIPEKDIVFEVSTPESFRLNFKKLCEIKKDVIIVTTGWYDHIDEVRKMVELAKTRVLWSSNFSIGVNMYFKLIEYASKLINNEIDYDVWGTEIHHKNKVDSPSGTAKILESILLNNITRKTSIIEETLHRKIKDNEIHFSSTRGGLVNFGHTIGFDSMADTIEIKHTARDRSGYALGAVKAAEWLSQQPSGFYSMDDFLKEKFTI